jgi:DNA-binding NarL/FixJ family response regulator
MDMQLSPAPSGLRHAPMNLDSILALKVPGLRVVIIEDSKIIRERLEESLALIRNVEVVGHADNEMDALLLLRNVRWNVALIDLQLKVGTGIGVLKALGESAADDGHRIIVFTNYAYPPYETRCRALGAAHFFDKSRQWGSMMELITKLADADNAG